MGSKGCGVNHIFFVIKVGFFKMIELSEVNEDGPSIYL
jgi:hypothetical protein